MAIGRLGSLKTSLTLGLNDNTELYLASGSLSDVTVSVTNQGYETASYFVGISSGSISAIHDSDYIVWNKKIKPNESTSLNVGIKSGDLIFCKASQPEVGFLAFSTFDYNSGISTYYGRENSLKTSDDVNTPNTNIEIFRSSRNSKATLVINNKNAEEVFVSAGISSSGTTYFKSGDYLVKALKLAPRQSVTISDIGVGEDQSLIVRASKVDVSFTVFSVPANPDESTGGATGAPTFSYGINVVGLSTFYGSGETRNITIGSGSTSLIVHGDARVLGILTIGSSSLTLDGTNNQVNVGSGVTIHHTNGVQVGSNTLHSSGLSLNTLNVSGVTTLTDTSSINLTSQQLNVSGVTTLGITTAKSVFAVGVVTATSFVKIGGTSTEFLKADGTIDATTYLTSATVGGESDNVPGQIVSRNGYGGFSSGIVTATAVHINNALETVATATTYQNGSFNNVIVECDIDQGSIFTHNIGTNGTVGIVSFKDFPAIKNSAVTYTIIFTQQSTTPAGTGNTTGSTGIGTHIFVQPLGVTGFSTSTIISTGSTVTLSSTPNDVDFVSFVIHYNGAGAGTQSNYKVFSSSNGQFRFGGIGV